MATYELIAKVTLGSNATSILFGSIPSTFDDLLILFSTRAVFAGQSTDDLVMRFNTADSGFSQRVLRGSGSTVTSTSLTGAAQIYVSIVPASTATANTFSNTEIYIPNYAGATNKSVSATGVQENNSTTAYIQATAGLWSSTAAIYQVVFYMNGGGVFAANSSAYLYGITKA